MKNLLIFILASIAGVLIIGVAYAFVALINIGAIVLVPVVLVIFLLCALIGSYNRKQNNKSNKV